MDVVELFLSLRLIEVSGPLINYRLSDIIILKISQFQMSKISPTLKIVIILDQK